MSHDNQWTLQSVMSPLSSMQGYYKHICAQRYEQDAKEGPLEVALFLSEEVGEFSRAVRKTLGMERVSEYPEDCHPGHELADIFLYALHAANKLGIDLAEMVVEKERINAKKAHDRALKRIQDEANSAGP